MEEVVLCDTNVIIELYKHKNQIIAELRRIQEKNMVISAISVGELIYGALDKRELNKLLKDLSALRILSLNEEITTLHLQLMTKYSLSHNLSLPDALIAATALYYEYPLFTLNRKDFQYIEGVSLYRPSWIDG